MQYYIVHSETAKDLRHGIEIRQFKFTLLKLHRVRVRGEVRDSWR